MAATGSAARICGLADVGTIAPGKIADVLIVGSDPTKDARAGLEDVRAVLREGKPVLSRIPDLGKPIWL